MSPSSQFSNTNIKVKRKEEKPFRPPRHPPKSDRPKSRRQDKVKIITTP